MIPRIPRLPLVGDPLHRIRVPDDLDEVTSVAAEQPADSVGLEPEKLERIWRTAQSLYKTGVHPALQLCVRRDGHVVLDRAVGHARGNGPDESLEEPVIQVSPDTPFCVFSSSKAVTAMVIHVLQERGALEISDRVTDYIPEYGSHGKGETTIGHVLSHRAGVPGLPKAMLDLDRVEDHEFMTRTICDTKPIVRPGTLLAYHAISGGFILGEIVRRVSGRSIRDVLADEILGPLGFRWGNYGVAAEDVERVGHNYVTGPPLLPPLSMLASRVLSQPIKKVVELSNDPRFLRAILPSANVVTTGNELGRFFEIMRAGGELDGVRVMSVETIHRALEEQSRLEIDLTLGFPARFGYGLMLGAKVLSLYGLDTDLAFGHLGLINIMGWADPERAISVGLITSGKALIYPELVRFYALMSRITSEMPKVPPSERLV